MFKLQPVSKYVRLLIVFGLLLTSFPLPMSVSASAPDRLEDKQSPVPESGLVRTWVTYPNTVGRARLDEIGVVVLEEDGDRALLLATAIQLETLARLRFEPSGSDDLGTLLHHHAATTPWLSISMQPMLGQATDLWRETEQLERQQQQLQHRVEQEPEALQTLSTIESSLNLLRQDLLTTLHTVTAEQQAAMAILTSIDSDGDGLTDTEEYWWCTDPHNPDSDGDGVSDGNEVAALKDWMSNRLPGPPASGKPFAGWPPLTSSAGYPDRLFACQDDDRDSVPDMVERWALGLNMNRESTSRDKFDDGQKLFGQTNCPGSGGFCGYGVLPRNEDWGVIFAEMPAWVEAPGNHPLVAAFPVIEVTLVTDTHGNTFLIETVTEITTDRVIAQGTSKSYATSNTTGTTTEISSGLMHNEWQEVAKAYAQVITTTTLMNGTSQTINNGLPWPDNWIESADQFIRKVGPLHNALDLSNAHPAIQDAIDDAASLIESGFQVGVPTVRTALALPMAAWGGINCLFNEHEVTVEAGPISVNIDKVTGMACKDYLQLAAEMSPELAEFLPSLQGESVIAEENIYSPEEARVSPLAAPSPIVVNNTLDTSGVTQGLEGIRLAHLETGELISERLYEINQGLGNIAYSLDDISSGIYDVSEGIGQIANILAAPVETSTNVSGYSVTQSQTTAHANTESYTITNGEQFSNQESWGTATAINSAHAADLRFTYQVRNSGTEYAREIANLVFNIYVGNDWIPIYTYFVATDVGGDGKFHMFMPGESHVYTAQIPLSLQQMGRIDSGETVRIIVEDYTYGIDELFYQDAVRSGIVVGFDDGILDGDAEDDIYLFATWGEESVLDVLARYFPLLTDGDGNLVAMWTPEYRWDLPDWCVEPFRTGATLWCKHSLSTAESWKIHLSAPGNTAIRYHDEPAIPGSLVYFRFLRDTDLDGYTDLNELALGTDPYDATSFPKPEMIAGIHHAQSGNVVTATLSLLNLGLDDAKIVQATMIAPDDSITIVDNTVGGSAQVRSQQRVNVAGKVVLARPTPAIWASPGHAYPLVTGDFTGSEIITYTFTVNCSEPGGCNVGGGVWDLIWTDTAGNSDSLSYGGGYHSPEYLSVGILGLKLGLVNGQVQQGDSFSVVAVPARDTFKYTINATPPEIYTPPIVIVSYNDARGSHRFVVPPSAMSLSDPNADLAIYSGMMLPDPGVEILASNAITLGTNSTNLFVYNPTDMSIDGARIHVEYISADGIVVHRVELTQNILPGPNVLEFEWSTSEFSPAFATNENYIMMVFLADSQNNIIDIATQSLFFFYSDSPMKVHVPIWNTDLGAFLHLESYSASFTLLGASYMVGAGQQSASYSLRGNAGQPTQGNQMVSDNYRLSTGFWPAVQPQAQTMALSVMPMSLTNDAVERFATHCFALANTGRHPLKLRALPPDNSILVTKAPLATLESGEQTEVCVRLNTDGFNIGAFTKLLPVYTSDPTNPVVNLQLTGEIVTSGNLVFVYDYQNDARPLNRIARVNSERIAGSLVNFAHDIGGNTASLQPLLLLAGDGVTELGRGIALGGTNLRPLIGDDGATEMTLPESTTVRRDYVVQYGYQLDLPAGGGQQMTQITLPNHNYGEVSLDILVHNLAGSNLTLSLDVGDNGSMDWSFSGNVVGDKIVVDGLAAAVNAYRAGQSGDEVVVPIRFVSDTQGSYFLANIVGAPSTELDLAPINFTVSDPVAVETEVVQLCATVANFGKGHVDTVVVDYIVAHPHPEVDANILIDYAFLSGLAAEGGQQSECVDWDTTGFTGEITLYAVADFANQLTESDKTNNVISTTLTVLSRPDLFVRAIELNSAIPPAAGEPVIVEAILRNDGQTNASISVLALYEGDPAQDGILIGEEIVSVTSDSEFTATFTWTPSRPGPHRLFALADRDNEINESDKSNNRNWRDVYAGLAGPLLLNSGTVADIPYSVETGYGYIDDGETTTVISCHDGLTPEDNIRLDLLGRLEYRFDHLTPGRFYHLNITLYECDSAGRQQTISVNGIPLAGPIDLSGGNVQKLSLLLDPALYVQNSINVVIESPGIDGAVVSEVNLYDVDYRYANSGGNQDPQYPGLRSYGWLNGAANTVWGILPYQSVRANPLANQVQYRFDNLDVNKRYNLNMTFWQPSGTARMQKVQINGIDTGLIVDTGDYQIHRESIPVPVGDYAADGAIIVSVVRLNASSGAMVSEIALEEDTLLFVPDLCPKVWSTDFVVSDNGAGVNTLTIGQGPNATDGLDVDCGEALLPPPPPSGSFDTRLVLPGGALESLQDFRSESLTQADWQLKFQPGSGGYPFTFSWDSDSLPPGSMRLKDMFGGIIVDVDMKAQSSYVLSLTGITQLKVEYRLNTCLDVPVTSGWNMVSVPVVAANMQLSTLFPGVATPAYYYTNAYQPVQGIDALQTGRGYWMYFASPQSYQICGSAVTAQDITVNAGWNMIGSFDGLVPVNSISSTPASILNPPLYEYANGYLQDSVLNPGKGYWAYATQPGTLHLGGASGSSAPSAPPMEESVGGPVDFRLPLTIQAGDNSMTVRIGVSPQGSAGYDAELDWLAPPRPPAGAFTAHLVWNDLEYLMDVRGADQPEQTYVLRYQMVEEESIILSWDRDRLSALGVFELMDLLDGDGTRLDMSTVDELVIEPGGYLSEGLMIRFEPKAVLGPYQIYLPLVID